MAAYPGGHRGVRGFQWLLKSHWAGLDIVVTSDVRLEASMGVDELNGWLYGLHGLKGFQ